MTNFTPDNFAILFAYATVVQAQDMSAIKPETGTQASIALKGRTVFFTLSSANGTHEESFLVDSEKPIPLRRLNNFGN